MQNSQNAKELSENSKQRMRHFDIGQAVLARNYGRGDTWVIGTIIKQIGPISYVVKVGHSHWKRHLDQLRNTELLMPEDEQLTVTGPQKQTDPVLLQPPAEFSDGHYTELTQPAECLEKEVILPPPGYFGNETVPDSSTSSEPLEVEQHSRPKRDTRPPTWLKDYYVH